MAVKEKVRSAAEESKPLKAAPQPLNSKSGDIRSSNSTSNSAKKVLGGRPTIRPTAPPNLLGIKGLPGSSKALLKNVQTTAGKRKFSEAPQGPQKKRAR